MPFCSLLLSCLPARECEVFQYDRCPICQKLCRVITIAIEPNGLKTRAYRSTYPYPMPNMLSPHQKPLYLYDGIIRTYGEGCAACQWLRSPGQRPTLVP